MEETLGKRIIAHRKRIGLTQDKLAEKLGVTAQAVSKWENDQSCPDITMLPKLAQIFGITTDALLGLEAEQPPQPEAVTPEVIPEPPELADRHWELHWNAGKMGQLGFAIWVLLCGGLLLASYLLDWKAGLWDILWPSALLVLNVFGLLKRFSFWYLGCALVGGYFLLRNLGVPMPIPGKELLLPVAILVLGLSLLLEALRQPKKPHFQILNRGKGGRHVAEHEYTPTDTGFSASTSFGSNRCLVDLPLLTHGRAEVSFGELTIDLSGCQSIAAGCTIGADCSFGQLRILVPSSCRVEQESSSAFGNVSFRGKPCPDAAVTMYLACDVSFGEITVEYI